MKELADYLKETNLLDRPVDGSKIKLFDDEIKDIKNKSGRKVSENTEENVKANIKKVLDSYEEYSVSLNENDIDLQVKKDGKVRAVFECKRPGSNEMISVDNLNNKAIHELVLNYIEEYLRSQNKDNVDWLIATNGLEWFVFSKGSFLRNFAENPVFRDFIGIGTLFDIQKRNKKDIYGDIENYLNNHPGVLKQLDCLHIDAENDKEFAKELYLLLSPDILLKQFNPNIGNVLKNNFYNELLYIIGLQETNDKKIVSADVSGSFYQQVTELLKRRDVSEENIFESTLDLLIIWFNRILFLKLFETRLISFNGGNNSFKFMDKNRIPDFSKMKQLFFQVLAVPESARSTNLQQSFKDIPYLNSSLFEEKELENKVSISDISASDPVEYYKGTVLKDQNTGKPRRGNVALLDYLFDFLSAYEFGTESRANADLISPAVLGLIFEKINGYKDGSYYTPSEITDFMAEKAIKNEIVNKVNAELKTSWETFEDFENAFFEGHIDKKVVRNMVDNLKILDPAVGSAHFLVSALNVLLIIKWKFGFITDVKEQSFKALYDIETSNGDLLYKEKETGKIFVYRKPKQNGEKQQEFQKAIFNTEKQIIEKNLFGVDINPKAVEIAHLRMWIELLKNTYYTEESNFDEMETLPNIDINIKEGDSLLAPIADISTGIFTDTSISNYRGLFTQYQNASDKSDKQKIKDDMIEERNILKQGIDATYDKLIWTVDFPQILNDNGEFIGFDIVIANPPYISLGKFRGNPIQNAYKNQGYEVYDSSGDIYCLFDERGLDLLESNGILCYITSNKWMRAGYGEKLRAFFAKYNPKVLIDMGSGIFESATVDTNILLIQKAKNENNLKALTLVKENGAINIQKQLQEKSVILRNLGKDTWFIGDDKELKLKAKIEKVGTQLKDWDVKIYRGILTGLNEAFIIDNTKREEILNNCKDKDERKRTEEIIKPILRGRDIKRYYYEWAGLWVVVIPASWTNENRRGEKAEIFIARTFPSLMNYLEPFEEKAKKRDDQGDYWWELRQCAYYPEFEKEKVVWAETDQALNTVLVPKNFYLQKTCFMIVGNCLSYISGTLNSNLIQWYIRRKAPVLGKKGMSLAKDAVQETPTIPITPDNESEVKQIESLVDQILAQKNANPDADTSDFESQIDTLVYQLYGLTEEETQIIKNQRL